MSTVTGTTTVNVLQTDNRPTPQRNRSTTQSESPSVPSENTATTISPGPALARNATAQVQRQNAIGAAQDAERADDVNKTTQQIVDERAEASLDTQALQEVVSDLNDFVQNVQRDISFNLDESTGSVVVRVKNADTDEVIRQIPSDEVLALKERLTNDTDTVPTGLVLNARV